MTTRWHHKPDGLEKGSRFRRIVHRRVTDHGQALRDRYFINFWDADWGSKSRRSSLSYLGFIFVSASAPPPPLHPTIVNHRN